MREKTPKLNFHLGDGILIGMGIMLIALGFLGWIWVIYLNGTLSRIFEEVGLDPSRHFIFRDLTRLISTYMWSVVVGVVSLLFGVLFERKRMLSHFVEKKSPHTRLIGALWGGGGALALTSLRSLFYYLFTSDYFDLDFFIVFGTIGVFLIIVGVIIYTRK